MTRTASQRGRTRGRTPLVIGVAAVVVALGLFLGLTATAPKNAVTVVLAAGHARAVPPGARYFRPPGTRVVNEPRSGTFLFPGDEAYRLYARDGAEIPATFTIRYTLQDPGPVLEFLSRAPNGNPAAGFAPEVIGGAFRKAARPAAAGIDAAVIYQTQGRALVDALTRQVVLPRGVQAEVTLQSLAMSASAQRSLVAGRADVRGRRVLFIGIDALDWGLLDPLLAEGRMPNLERLIRGGVRADLHTMTPILSPLIWTTMATGVGPERHGILDFFVKDPQTGRMVPATSAARRVPAFWNIATNYGRTVNVVGWLATWPAEAINGTLVSDRFGFLAYAAGQIANDQADDVISPAAFLGEARRLAFRPEDLTFEKVTRFLDISRAELAAARTGGYKRGNLVNNFLLTYATAETYRRIGVDLVRKQADLSAVYFEFIDAMGHLFMPYAPPRRATVSVADFDRYRDAVKIAYVEMDQMAGSLLDAAGDSTIVIVASDHGFLSGSSRPGGSAAMEAGQAARWHRDPGVLILAGPGIRRGERLGQASVMDIAPTLLHLAGLPVSEELEGHVLTGAFTAADLSAHPVQTIDRYRLSADVWSPPAGAAAAGVEPAGRPGAPASDTTAAVGEGVAQASGHVNLGLVLDKKGDLAGAEAQYRQALKLSPGDLNALNNLAGVLQRTDRLAEATDILNDILKNRSDYAPAWVNLGICRLRQDDSGGAVTAFDRALALEPGNVRALVNRGHARLHLKQTEAAEKDFSQALVLAPGDVNAHFGLGLLAAERGDYEAARREFHRTLELDPRHQSARENLDKLAGIH